MRALEDAGIQVWRDTTAIRSGASITQALRGGLASARALAVFASRDYFDSMICAWELASAWIAAEQAGEGGRRVLLFLPEDVANLEHVRHGPLGDCRAFEIPTGELEVVAAAMCDPVSN